MATLHPSPTEKANAARIVGALTLTKLGDRIVDPKTVLAWLLASSGAAPALTAMLVPVRESGSLLPQALLTPVVRRAALRKWVWVAGSAGQALAVGIMAVVAAYTNGALTGWGVLGALAVFALSRALSSISVKDVMGRTVPKGRRGRVTGASASMAGAATITLGLGIRLLGGDAAGALVYARLLAVAAAVWLLAIVVFSTVHEPPGERDGTAQREAAQRAWHLLRDDAPFRRFVVVRGLLLVSALSPPFVVTLATDAGGSEFPRLGLFIAASGVAQVVSSPVWGRAADRSSRTVMTLAAAAASAVAVAVVVAVQVPAVRTQTWLYPLAYLGLATAHAGARVGRSTYVVDLGGGSKRTDYVAVSNTVIGALLLVTGVMSSVAAAASVEAALVLLAAMGAGGAALSRTLPEVSVGHS